MAQRLILCDIDGVIADCSHRLKYAQEKNWDKFYSDEEVNADDPIPEGLGLLRVLAQHGQIHFITGRNDRCRGTTGAWLGRNLSSYDLLGSILAMRDDGDYRPSPEVKVDLIRELFKELRSRESEFVTQDVNPTYFIDDDPENVKAVCAAFPQIIGITFGVGRVK